MRTKSKLFFRTGKKALKVSSSEIVIRESHPLKISGGSLHSAQIEISLRVIRAKEILKIVISIMTHYSRK